MYIAKKKNLCDNTEQKKIGSIVRIMIKNSIFIPLEIHFFN